MASALVRRKVLRISAWFVAGLAACFTQDSSARAAEDQEPPAPATGLAPELVELIALHNQERAAAKLAPLVANDKLVAAAQIHARDMADHDKMSHEGSDGSMFNQRIERQGYYGRRMAENVAMGQRSVASVMREWMKSEHHRENILGEFSEIGVARALSGDGTPYWCTTFGLPRPKLDRDDATAGVVEAVNLARSKAEKPPLKLSRKLSQSAQKVAEELAALGNLREGKPTYADVVRQDGYRYRLLGEAAASGQPTADEAVQTWLGAPVHRENFLGKFSEIGVGFATSEKGIPFWMVFLAQPLR